MRLLGYSWLKEDFMNTEDIKLTYGVKEVDPSEIDSCPPVSKQEFHETLELLKAADLSNVLFKFTPYD